MGVAQLYHTLIYKVKCNLRAYQVDKDREELRKKILAYYESNKPEDTDIQETVEYLRHHKLTNILMPGHKAASGNLNKVLLNIDKACGLPYVNHEGKKLYFQKEATVKTLKNHYLSLLREQSPHSPHLYTNEHFDVKEGYIIYDIGSAEGIFALTHIDKAKYVVLFEADEEWLKALHATFAPWKDKVVIVPKYVSDIDDDQNSTISSFIKENPHLVPDFIKIDVEGAEMKVMKGMGEHMGRKGLKMAVTTYHYLNDYQEISAFLSQWGFLQEPSEGVTLLTLEEQRAPFFRKGLIRATNI